MSVRLSHKQWLFCLGSQLARKVVNKLRATKEFERQFSWYHLKTQTKPSFYYHLYLGLKHCPKSNGLYQLIYQSSIRESKVIILELLIVEPGYFWKKFIYVVLVSNGRSMFFLSSSYSRVITRRLFFILSQLVSYTSLAGAKLGFAIILLHRLTWLDIIVIA